MSLKENILIRLEGVTAVTVKGARFWDVNSCTPVEIHRRVGGRAEE
jgi:hypothetical protein